MPDWRFDPAEAGVLTGHQLVGSRDIAGALCVHFAWGFWGGSKVWGDILRTVISVPSQEARPRKQSLQRGCTLTCELLCLQAAAVRPTEQAVPPALWANPFVGSSCCSSFCFLLAGHVVNRGKEVLPEHRVRAECRGSREHPYGRGRRVVPCFLSWQLHWMLCLKIRPALLV